MKHALELVIAVFTVLTIIATGAASAGDKTGNGAGMAEHNFVYAYWSLDRLLAPCLEKQDCGLNRSQTKLLEAIIAALPAERESNSPEGLRFLSGKQHPEIFKIGAQQKVAVTKPTPLAPIYINTDLIYWEDAYGNSRPLSTPAAVAILVHELGHHQGIVSESKLNEFSAKLRIWLQDATPVEAGTNIRREIAVNRCWVLPQGTKVKAGTPPKAVCITKIKVELPAAGRKLIYVEGTTDGVPFNEHNVFEDDIEISYSKKVAAAPSGASFIGVEVACNTIYAKTDIYHDCHEEYLSTIVGVTLFNNGSIKSVDVSAINVVSEWVNREMAPGSCDTSTEETDFEQVK